MRKGYVGIGIKNGFLVAFFLAVICVTFFSGCSPSVGTEIDGAEEVGASEYYAEYTNGKVIIKSSMEVSPFDPITTLTFSRTSEGLLLESATEALPSTEYSIFHCNVYKFEVAGVKERVYLFNYNENGKTSAEVSGGFVIDYTVFIMSVNCIIEGNLVDMEFEYSRLVSLSPKTLERATITRSIDISTFNAFSKL